ncbi:MAG: GNAT family N-acetyltransferase, partial [Planctomycetota bacterium]|nr:GNAT family N-acetyltransferase [Planctomycetota bacterium]
DPWEHGFAVVHATEQRVIGNVGFKGPPDEEGNVEIAYAIVRGFRRRGFATEAATAAVRFAFDHPAVRAIRAHTLPELNASTRVLDHCGFKLQGSIDDADDGPVWRWERKANEIPLHEWIDLHYGDDGDAELARRLDVGGEDLDARRGTRSETPLHVAVRRRRVGATTILLDRGADIDARTAGGKTAYAHAARRGFSELVDQLATRGADIALSDADRFGVAVVNGRLDEARDLLAAHPDVVRTGNPEEDRLLADVAGRDATEPVAWLIEAGADLTATGLDGGTPLHQAAWFGQPEHVRLLLAAGAPFEVFDPVHQSSPLGWAVHGSRHSGGAEAREAKYVECARRLLKAGAHLYYPGEPEDDAFLRRLLRDASSSVEALLRQASRTAS